MGTKRRTGTINALLIAVMLSAVFPACGQDAALSGDSEAVFNARMMSSIFVEIAREVGPSVVTITSQTTVITMIPSFPDLSDPFKTDTFDDFFSPPHEQEYVITGVGSGVIVSEDGLILTNHHVVGAADEVEVTLNSGEQYFGELVGTDPATDLALIRIDADRLPIITIGDSDELEVGQWVLAVGSPFALSQTVTQGIVSYLGRSDVGLVDFENYIQTDAAINPGNSGGALVNLEGELIGINTAIVTRNGGYQGIGFAIPVNVAVAVMEDLVEYGYVRRGWLGVNVQELTPFLADQFGLPESRFGILVAQVLNGTPAREFGIERGDVILTVNGNSFNTLTEFRGMIADIEPGITTEIGIFRQGRNLVVEVVLGEREQVTQAEVTPPISEEYGWALSELDETLARSLGDHSLRGVLVLEVEPAGRAAHAGIQSGDVILEVDGFEAMTPAQVEGLISTSDEVLILIWRQGLSIYLML